MDLLELNENGLYCAAGDFYIDPWRNVEKAIITHAHSDHARVGSRYYLCSTEGLSVTRARLGEEAHISTLDYGQSTHLNGVKVSLHPAGHILGSAQVRVEYQGEVWVVSGDYKTEADSATCTPYESVPCHTFISESTFGLPVYRWQPQQHVFNEINQWWRHNQSHGRASLLMAYGLGKTQRILAGIDCSTGPIFVHGSIVKMNEAYQLSGYQLPEVKLVQEAPTGFNWSSALIIAPPSAEAGTWVKRFGDYSNAFASGWMMLRGTRRRQSLDKGFVLSDHADWPGLLQAVKACACQRVIFTHGYSHIMARYFSEQGYQAAVLETHFQGEQGEE